MSHVIAKSNFVFMEMRIHLRTTSVQMTEYSLKLCYNIGPFNSCICYSRITNNNTTSINVKCKDDRKDRAFRLHATKTQKQKQAQLHSFFISELDERPVDQEVQCRPQSRQGLLEKRKIYCPSRESRSGSPSPQPSRYTDRAIPTNEYETVQRIC